MSMIRDLRIRNLINPPIWPLEYDTFLMAQLEHLSSPYDHLQDCETFNYIIVQTAAEMTRTYEHEITTVKVKKRLQVLRDRFDKFLSFIFQPGVRYHRTINRVTIKPSYLNNLNREESDLNRYFRQNGFPFYRICQTVFQDKLAAEIDFSDDPGTTINNPIV